MKKLKTILNWILQKRFHENLTVSKCCYIGISDNDPFNLLFE